MSKRMKAARRYIGLPEAAEAYGVSIMSLRKLIDQGKLKAHRPLPGGWKILLRVSELDALFEGSVREGVTG
jgi:excisionase family DNA binding protein